jgi:hypothetical protein
LGVWGNKWYPQLWQVIQFRKSKRYRNQEFLICYMCWSESTPRPSPKASQGCKWKS